MLEPGLGCVRDTCHTSAQQQGSRPADTSDLALMGRDQPRAGPANPPSAGGVIVGQAASVQGTISAHRLLLSGATCEQPGEGAVDMKRREGLRRWVIGKASTGRQLTLHKEVVAALHNGWPSAGDTDSVCACRPDLDGDGSDRDIHGSALPSAAGAPADPARPAGQAGDAAAHTRATIPHSPLSRRRGFGTSRLRACRHRRDASAWSRREDHPRCSKLLATSARLCDISETACRVSCL